MLAYLGNKQFQNKTNDHKRSKSTLFLFFSLQLWKQRFPTGYEGSINVTRRSANVGGDIFQADQSVTATSYEGE